MKIEMNEDEIKTALTYYIYSTYQVNVGEEDIEIFAQLPEQALKNPHAPFHVDVSAAVEL